MRKKQEILVAVALTMGLGAVSLSQVFAQDQGLPPGTGFEIRVLTEREVGELPEGPLFWSIETFPSLSEAEAAGGPWGLATEAGGKAWLFTLGPKGSETAGGTLVAEVGPLPEVAATRYLLRVNEANAVPGGSTKVHTHPGAEAFYALEGVIGIRSPEGEMTIEADHAMAGHAPGTIMQVYNGSATDLHGLVMFLVDADQPFSSPAEFP